MAKAARSFNAKPKNGLKYLKEKGYIPTEPGEAQTKAIAQFVRTTPNLSATTLGQFFGGADQLNKDVLSRYVDDLDFTDKSLGFVAALKQLLSNFRVPGEAQ